MMENKHYPHTGGEGDRQGVAGKWMSDVKPGSKLLLGKSIHSVRYRLTVKTGKCDFPELNSGQRFSLLRRCSY